MSKTTKKTRYSDIDKNFKRLAGLLAVMSSSISEFTEVKNREFTHMNRLAVKGLLKNMSEIVKEAQAEYLKFTKINSKKLTSTQHDEFSLFIVSKELESLEVSNIFLTTIVSDFSNPAESESLKLLKANMEGLTGKTQDTVPVKILNDIIEFLDNSEFKTGTKVKRATKRMEILKIELSGQDTFTTTQKDFMVKLLEPIVTELTPEHEDIKKKLYEILKAFDTKE